jgi:Domain of unknown function (DUF4214)/RTX calcium-binding nonapeptide repeat (4 copies)
MAAPVAYTTRSGFSYTLQLNDPNNLLGDLQAGTLLNLRAAIENWGQFLQTTATINFELQVKPFDTRATGISTGFTFVGVQNGHELWDNFGQHKLITGQDLNGAEPDFVIIIDPTYYRQSIWNDPDPFARTAPVPKTGANYDAVSMFQHELMHAFGMWGFADPATGINNSKDVSRYDALQRSDATGVYFTGAATRAVYGGDLPLSTAWDVNPNYTHYGRTAADGLEHNLMEGSTYSITGDRWYIDRIDLAMLQDVGVPVRPLSAATQGTVAIAYAGRPNTIVTGSGNDRLIGSTGDDTFQGNGGDDFIDGGGGRNTAAYRGSHTEYALSRTADGTMTVGDRVVDRDGTDTLVHIQRLQFTDGIVLHDDTGNMAPAFRLYQAAFNRLPDEGGLVWQTMALDQGFALLQISKNFYDSAEFRATYGTLTNEQFASQLYHNVLHRDPDPAGLAWQVAALDGGISREQILLNFSESPENVSRTAANTKDGWIWIG